MLFKKIYGNCYFVQLCSHKLVKFTPFNLTCRCKFCQLRQFSSMENFIKLNTSKLAKLTPSAAKIGRRQSCQFSSVQL